MYILQQQQQRDRDSGLYEIQENYFLNIFVRMVILNNF